MKKPIDVLSRYRLLIQRVDTGLDAECAVCRAGDVKPLGTFRKESCKHENLVTYHKTPKSRDKPGSCQRSNGLINGMKVGRSLKTIDYRFVRTIGVCERCGMIENEFFWITPTSHTWKESRNPTERVLNRESAFHPGFAFCETVQRLEYSSTLH